MSRVNCIQRLLVGFTIIRPSVSPTFSFVVGRTIDRLPDLSLTDSILLDVFCALVVHIIYNKYEISPANLSATLALLFGVPSVPVYFLALHVQSAIIAIILGFLLFYATLVLSIMLYRVSPLHPLAKYPGPLSLKMAKFVVAYRAIGGKQYAYFKKLHDEFGPFVRVGPNELSVVDLEAIAPILGIDDTRRGPLWDTHYKPGTAPHIVALRDMEEYHERRKLWNRGFITSALNELQPFVESRVLELVEELGKRSTSDGSNEETIVDLTQWLANFTYDLMGDMIFGKGLDLMRDGDEGGIRALLENDVKTIGVLGHISWIVGLVSKFALESEERRKYHKFVVGRYELRKKRESGRRHLFRYINEDGLEVPRDQGLSEIFAAFLGAADSIATVLSGLFFYLLSNPEALDQLRREVDAEFPAGEGEPFGAVKLAGMPYLNAVINEALRLQQPSSTALQRGPLEGSGGKTVAGRLVLISFV